MIRVRTVLTGVAGAPWFLNAYFGGSDQAAADDAMTRWRAFLEAVRPQTQAGVTFTNEPTAVVINPATGEPTNVLQVTTGPNTAGGDQNQLLPRANQVLVSLKTGVFDGGRQIQGRLNLPGRTQSSLGSGGLVASATQTAINNAAAGLLDEDINSGLVVWSRKAGLAVKVGSATVNQEFAVLRSRRD